MSTIICRVVSQTEPSFVNSQKNGQMAKCYIRLKELGGPGAPEYTAAVLGNLAEVRFQKDELVAAALKFRMFESNGNAYQDVTATDIVKL